MSLPAERYARMAIDTREVGLFPRSQASTEKMWVETENLNLRNTNGREIDNGELACPEKESSQSKSSTF